MNASLKRWIGDLVSIFYLKRPQYSVIDEDEYRRQFEGREGEAFRIALEARKFEIQMYWTRTAYFWTLTGAALAGFFASATSIAEIYSFVIACIGVVLSLGWALANKGSKYWQENWENHVQMLEDSTIGPLHKTLLYRGAEPFRMRYDLISQLMTGPSGFSVSKINSIFSWFFFVVWSVLAIRMVPVSRFDEDYNVSWSYVSFSIVGLFFVFLLVRFSKTWVHDQEHEARVFTEAVVVDPSRKRNKGDGGN